MSATSSENTDKEDRIIINLDHLEQIYVYAPKELIYKSECEKWAEQIIQDLKFIGGRVL